MYSGEYDHAPCGVSLLCDFHRRMFRGVRGHAGRTRHDGFGQETLAFGPNRSEHRLLVPDKLAQLFERAAQLIQSLENDPSSERYERDAIELAVWVHAQVIRIHPFEDGNGRTSRLMMNWLLIRLGLRPIVVDAVKQEYHACLNTFYSERDVGPLFHLFLRLAIPKP